MIIEKHYNRMLKIFKVFKGSKTPPFEKGLLCGRYIGPTVKASNKNIFLAGQMKSGLKGRYTAAHIIWGSL